MAYSSGLSAPGLELFNVTAGWADKQPAIGQNQLVGVWELRGWSLKKGRSKGLVQFQVIQLKRWIGMSESALVIYTSSRFTRPVMLFGWILLLPFFVEQLKLKWLSIMRLSLSIAIPQEIITIFQNSILLCFVLGVLILCYMWVHSLKRRTKTKLRLTA